MRGGAKVAKMYYDIKSNHGSYKRDLVLLYDPTRKKRLKEQNEDSIEWPLCCYQFSIERYL